MQNLNTMKQKIKVFKGRRLIINLLQTNKIFTFNFEETNNLGCKMTDYTYLLICIEIHFLLEKMKLSSDCMRSRFQKMILCHIVYIEESILFC
jgi:hypothetical protein